MLILDLWGISFHPAVVVGLGNDLLFNSILGHCGRQRFSKRIEFEEAKILYGHLSLGHLLSCQSEVKITELCCKDFKGEQNVGIAVALSYNFTTVQQKESKWSMLQF